MSPHMITYPCPHNVGESVDNKRQHVEEIAPRGSVHRPSLQPEDVSSLSSTGSRVTNASVYRDRTLSSPESTVAKTTDENL